MTNFVAMALGAAVLLWILWRGLRALAAWVIIRIILRGGNTGPVPAPMFK